MSLQTPDNVTVIGPIGAGYAEILTPDALAFVADLARTFTGRVEELLARREQEQARYDAGEKPKFLAETQEIRDGDWTVAPLPKDLLDRRVEITGPVDRKMIINALNSGANVFMADFEDSNAPTWANQVEGQINLRDAIRGTIDFEDKARGKSYKLGDHPAVLMARPRGWHLWEKHLLVDDKPVPAGLFDFGLYFFHNAKALLDKGSGPYFYLPKLQSHLEARLWNDAFVKAQNDLGVPPGSIKATVLIETLPASFEMNEILYELREHSAGLNCGRWDYIFSFIKTFARDPNYVLPDRAEVGMTQPFMRAYTQLVIKTCHRRNVHAMGGMAAQIPIKNDPDANREAFQKVRTDKLREAKDGHDGTWVAHPGLVAVAREIFDDALTGPNQIDKKREDVAVTEADLVAVPTGNRTEAGLRQNIAVGVRYLAAWLRGQGCVPLYHLMEDAATAEISRTQVWQWIHHGADVGGETLTPERFRAVLGDEMAQLREEVGDDAAYATGKFDDAAELFTSLSLAEQCETFLTIRAYDKLTADTRGQ